MASSTCRLSLNTAGVNAGSPISEATRSSAPRVSAACFSAATIRSRSCADAATTASPHSATQAKATMRIWTALARMMRLSGLCGIQAVNRFGDTSCRQT